MAEQGDRERSQYPIAFTPEEFVRLDTQAVTLSDKMLETYGAKATHCLEIGCGIGSNIAKLKSNNTTLKYHGVDINPTAIEKARDIFKHDKNISFQKLDVFDLDRLQDSYDLIVCRLVLWSVGPRWQEVIAKAQACLRPGGVLYCFEPDDRLLFFTPRKPDAEALIKLWQDQCLEKGLNPFVGRDLYGAFNRLTWKDVQVRVHANISLGRKRDTYGQTVKNLERIFFGIGAQGLGLNENDARWVSGLSELNRICDEDMLIDQYFIVTGLK